MRKIFYIFLCWILSGCSTVPSVTKSIGEKNSGYTYIPLDPLPVATRAGTSCGEEYSEKAIFNIPTDAARQPKRILDALPDNAVRIAIKNYASSGKISFGAFNFGTAGERYQVILDYVNVDITNILFSINYLNDGTLQSVRRIPETTDSTALPKDNSIIVIPVYIGVGLRLTAEITVLKGTVNLASLGAIAAAAESGQVSGTLVLQTIGLTGKQISVLLPLPSELNQTTVQNAILALASIKAVIYDENTAITTPRVTGIYLPLPAGSPDLVNRIVSELARSSIPLYRGCELKKRSSS